MTERYSHRNGETEPPTVYERYYWFFAADTDRWYDEGPILYVMPPETDIGAYIDSVVEQGVRIPIDKPEGRWWGPIEPPWGVNNEQT